MLLTQFIKANPQVKLSVSLLVLMLLVTPTYRFVNEKPGIFGWTMFSKPPKHEKYVIMYSDSTKHLSRNEVINLTNMDFWLFPYGIEILKKLCATDSKLQLIQREDRFPFLFNCYPPYSLEINEE